MSRKTLGNPADGALLRELSRECYGRPVGGGHQCSQHADPSDEQVSTGFLPISLALTLLLSGLFVFGIVPMSCDASGTGPSGDDGAEPGLKNPTP